MGIYIYPRATWLILPVVICLSQGLSHARLSRSPPPAGETANGSIQQSQFTGWSWPSWITVVILELIHAPELRLCGGRGGAADGSGPRSLSVRSLREERFY